MTKKQHYMTENERYQLEAYLRAGKSKTWIAREMGFCRQTIHNEIKRGTYLHTVDYRDEPQYSAAKGQNIHDRAQLNKGRPEKIGRDIAYADYLEKKMLEERFSPAAALAEARKQDFVTSICVSTLYSYIYKGMFREMSAAELWEKPTRKAKTKKQEPKVAHKDLPTIEQRPESINQRSEPGHWEMDLVVGPEKTRAALLTLTERRSREEIIVKIPNRQARTVRRVWNRLERETEDFKSRFKSVTTDNGPEFLEYQKLIRSVLPGGGSRFNVYYCHSYASWEKGTNENHNRMIRRWIPKGTDIGKISNARIAEIQEWMNNYPRKSLGWLTPKEAAGL